jgi:phosphoserine phosphatase
MSRPTTSRVALADWDNTLCRGFTVMPWAEFLQDAGLFRGVDRLRALLKTVQHDSFNYEKFCRQMADAYAAGLVGRRQGDIVAAARTFVERDKVRVFGFVSALRSYLESCGLPLIVVTGAPDEVMRRYATAAGFALGGTLRLQVSDGVYTGKVLVNSGLDAEKSAAVARIITERTVAMAFGDAPSDRPLWEVSVLKFVVLTDAHAAHPFAEELIRINPSLLPDAVVDLVRRKASELLNP